ncbi:hypothetical protein SDC9_84295 [bioreactor metagenome]|uniref:Uncharacterized protein n=1 Tax=bioreactor metagenome TaxID=1076179 RepID=A0A644Z9W7_9ZZZZ
MCVHSYHGCVGIAFQILLTQFHIFSRNIHADDGIAIGCQLFHDPPVASGHFQNTFCPGEFFSDEIDLFVQILLHAGNIRFIHTEQALRIQLVSIIIIHYVLSLYYRVVVYKAPLQGPYYTVKNAVDWFNILLRDDSQ